MDDRTPGLYAVIPVAILHDKDLRPNAKLLYSEISALADERGYCYASNEYLGKPFGLAAKTVSSLVAQLGEKGYVRVEVIRDSNQAVEERQIWPQGWCSTLPSKMSIPPLKNEHTLPSKMSIPPLKNEEKINTSDNIYIPPKAPQGGQACEEKKKPRKHRDEWKEKADHLPVRFDGFWSFYCAVTPAVKTPGNRQAALRAWDKLAPDEQLVAKMGRALRQQSQTEDWQRGIGVPHASTWLNKHRWEDVVAGGGQALPQADQQPEGNDASWV